jgi:hypothetical protein
VIVTVPADTPETTPAETVAVAGLPLVHAPPEVASVSVVVAPEHTVTAVEGPIAPGVELIVTTAVDEQIPKV